MHVYINDIRRMPIIPIQKISQDNIVNIVDEILKLNMELNEEIKRFHELFNFKLSRKLIKYYTLSFEEFTQELIKKNATNLMFLEKEFEKSTAIVNPIIERINTLKSQLNYVIYGLYELTPKEIRLIERSIK